MVAILLVLVLAGLAFLGTSRLSSSADKAVSVSNVRKLQLANGLHATDNNGRFASTFTKGSEGKASVWDRNPTFHDAYVGASKAIEGNSQESRGK